MTFKPGHDPNRHMGGRPRGRIAAFRELLGDLTTDGKEIAQALRAIVLDPKASNKERIDASALLLSYLLGKPETSVSIEADVTAGPRVDVARVLAATVPPEIMARVVQQLDSDDVPLLAEVAGDQGGDEE